MDAPGSMIVGIEIGGTKLQACLGTAEGGVLHTVRHQVAPGSDASVILAWIEGAIADLRTNSLERGATIDAVGVGFGGPVHSQTGRVVTSHQVAGWDDFALQAWMEERAEAPAVVANDSNAAGWAEYRCGVGRGTQTFAYTNIGSGIGGALVVNGVLHDGQGTGAAEFGHTMAPEFDGEVATGFDRLENLCSGWAIEERLHRLEYVDPVLPLGQLCSGDPALLTCRDLGAAAHAEDPIALGELDRVARTIGYTLANAITLLAPEVIAVGGGVALIGDPLFERLRNAVDEFVFPPYRDTYRIEPAALGEQVVLVGALLLAGVTGR